MENIWIIGAGPIAQEYARVLIALHKNFTVIGRGSESARVFEEKTGISVIQGGLENYLLNKPSIPDFAFVAVKTVDLCKTCIGLIEYGVKKIFCEKPGFCEPQECSILAKYADSFSCKLFLAYNRRFYSSVLKAEEIIFDDAGIKSFNFEFTEWSHIIERLAQPKIALQNNFYGNTTHVIDLAFFLGGNPTQMHCYTSGELSWHKPAVFAGAGITDKGALFSYSANWAAPGRWGVELLTAKHRLYLRPMEQLQIQNIGSVAINPVEIDDSLDKEFKPGFYMETKAFLEGDYSRLCSIEEQALHVENIYNKINGRK